MRTPKCEKCGKSYPVGNLPNGIPSMLGIMQRNGKLLNICGMCICDLGRLKTDKEKDEFFRSIGVEI